MRILRYIISFVFALATGLTLLFCVTSIITVQHTIEHSRQIDAAFVQAAKYVDENVRATGAPPSPDDFERWAGASPSQLYGVNGMRLDLPPYSHGFTSEHGHPPNNGYVLSYWRGEWEETYVSWTKKSSLTFEPSSYYLFGSAVAQSLFCLLASAVLVFFSLKLWPSDKTLPR